MCGVYLFIIGNEAWNDGIGERSLNIAEMKGIKSDSRGRGLGFLLGFVAAVAYGMNPLFGVPVLADGMPASLLLFYRYLLAVPILGGMMLIRGIRFRVKRREMVWLVVLGLLMAASSITLFESYRHMAAGIASTILFVYPLMVAVIMVLFYRERLKPLTLSALVVGAVGIGLLFRGEDGGMLSLVGVILVMLSALTYAVYIVGVKKSPADRVPGFTVTFWVLVVGAVVFFVYSLFKGEVALPAGAVQWGNIVGLALFPTAISFLCTTESIARIGSTPTAILGAMEPVTALAIGITVFGEALTGREIIGVILILISVSATLMDR